MRIDNTLPPFYTHIPQVPAAERFSAPAIPARTDNFSRPATPTPAIIVDISPEGWAAYAAANATANADSKAAEPSATGSIGALGKIAAAEGLQGCETCKTRTYKDVSDDPSVSFQTPTHISPGQAASMVMAHESEHVSHEQAKADREGREVISQSVTLETSICPECGRVYVSGGVTRTVTAENDNHDTNEASLI